MTGTGSPHLFARGCVCEQCFGGTMSDIDVGCDDDGLSSDSNSEFSDFVPSNWVGAANVGGPAAADAVGYSSGEETDTDLIIDNISALLKSCFRKKRKCSDAECHYSKRQKSHQADQLDDHKKASNRGNLAWLSHIINSIHSDKRHIIGDYGFPFVFHINSSGAPRSFSQWIADHIQPDSGDIVVESGVIHLGAHGFSEVIGLENSGLEVKGDFEGSKEQFLSLMGFSELPTIKQFGKLLLTNDLPNEKYFICFMVVFLSRFLCPNSSTYPSTKYLGSLLVPSDVRNFNWASFSHNWFMESVRKYQKDKRKSKALSSKSNLTLGGCTYVPAVKYLDFADFG